MGGKLLLFKTLNVMSFLSFRCSKFSCTYYCTNSSHKTSYMWPWGTAQCSHAYALIKCCLSQSRMQLHEHDFFSVTTQVHFHMRLCPSIVYTDWCVLLTSWLSVTLRVVASLSKYREIVCNKSDWTWSSFTFAILNLWAHWLVKNTFFVWYQSKR
jgi:hypothetical protein